MTRKLTVAAGVLAAFGFAAAAYAQTAPARPAAAPAAAAPARPTIPPGPMIAGVCAVYQQGVVANSAVGKQVANRLKQLGDAVNAELRTEANAIEAEGRALDAQRTTPTITQEQFEQRQLALQQRLQAFDRKRQQRNRELTATEQKQINRVLTEMQPILAQVYAEKGCGLLLDRTSVLYLNPQMDVTDLVVTKLNAKIQTVGNFEREPDPQATPAAPRPAAPAAAPATPPRR
ncbi:MAG: OmpH family outer membrane protein [Caulobacteraceae bacterium]|nr:OmpH family outer membrane protein [Caulobacteraceae bacterium]